MGKIISKFHLLEKRVKLLNLELMGVYLIGDGNLALKGFKSMIKDIDIVVLSGGQFSLLLNFLQTSSPKLFVKQYMPQWDYNPGISAKYGHSLYGFNLDVFMKRVLNKLYLYESMISRAGVPKDFEYHEFLRVYLVSKEEIFLFKSVTSMKKIRDVKDLVTLVETKLKYEIIIQDIRKQH